MEARSCDDTITTRILRKQLDMAVALTIHSGQLQKLQRVLGHIKNGVPRAVVPAINRSLSSGRTVVKREIRKEYLIKAKDIPTTIRRATYGSLSGQIRIEQGMLPLSNFKVVPRGIQRRKNKRPLFAQVKKGGGGVIKSAFFIPGGGPYSRIGPSRHPIYLLKTISAAIMATQPSVGPAANKAMGDTFAKRIDHEMKRVLASAGGHS
jgi:hypothetical protein